MHNKKRTSLGQFDSEIEAAEAYNVAALQMKGDKAKLNCIDVPTDRGTATHNDIPAAACELSSVSNISGGVAQCSGLESTATNDLLSSDTAITAELQAIRTATMAELQAIFCLGSHVLWDSPAGTQSGTVTRSGAGTIDIKLDVTQRLATAPLMVGDTPNPKLCICTEHRNTTTISAAQSPPITDWWAPHDTKPCTLSAESKRHDTAYIPTALAMPLQSGLAAELSWLDGTSHDYDEEAVVGIPVSGQ